MGLKELVDNMGTFWAISEKLSPLPEDVFAAAIATFVDMWCFEHDEPLKQKGAEILGNILADRNKAIDALERRMEEQNEGLCL